MDRPKYIKDSIIYLQNSPNVEDRSLLDYLYTLEDKLHRRNMQIKALKEKNKGLEYARYTAESRANKYKTLIEKAEKFYSISLEKYFDR